MKKLLLMCCFSAAANALVFGQAVQVSKSEFTSKASHLNTLLEQNKANEAIAAWDEVHNMMMAELDGIKGKMKQAASANNATEKDHWNNVMKNQYGIYYSIVKAHSNMPANKALIKTKLNEFKAGLL